MGKDTFETVVQKLADLDVQYLNLHREYRRLKEENERMNDALEYVTTAKSGHYNSVENILNDFKFVIEETFKGT